MSDIKRVVKAGLVTGLCALGVCGLEKKYKFSRRLAEFAHSIEGVPFPGAMLYAFLATKQLRTLYASIADEIAASGHFERILDIGTGPGYLPIEIALRDADAVISGIDPSNDMVQIAEANARASRVGKNVDFGVGGPLSLPYPGRYFGMVTSVNVLHHWKNPSAVFDEVHHVLVPGGQFWICDYRHEIPIEQWESIRARLPLQLRIPFAVGPVASAIAAYSKDEMVALAERARFEEVLAEERTFTLFGEPMPVFNLIKMRKPLHTRDTAAPGEQ